MVYSWWEATECTVDLKDGLICWHLMPLAVLILPDAQTPCNSAFAAELVEFVGRDERGGLLTAAVQKRWPCSIAGGSSVKLRSGRLRCLNGEADEFMV